MADDGPFAGLSNGLDFARSYMIKNNTAAHYRLNAPVFIRKSTAPPETLIGFPLKTQNSIATSNGWTEIGIVFGIPPEGDINVTHFPNELGYMMLVIMDKDRRAVKVKHGIRDYSKLQAPNRVTPTDL